MQPDTAASSNDFSLTLARGLQVLELFTERAATLTTSEVADRLDLSRAAARRFLLTFVKLGYLDQVRGTFILTSKVHALGGRQGEGWDRWMRATPVVLDLANRANESVSISVLDGLDIRFVVRDPKRRIFSTRLVAGDRLPAHCSAAGKVLLASLDPGRLNDVLAAAPTLERRTPRTVTDTETLLAELRQVRLRSWASADDEMEIGTISIAVPIFDAANGVVAALAMASHKMRRTIDELREEFLPLLLDAAERISAYDEPPP